MRSKYRWTSGGLAQSEAARRLIALGLSLAFALAGALPASAAEVESDAKEILRSMSDYLKGLSSFSVDADVGNEGVDEQGQKIQLSSSASLVVERPDKLYGHRRSGAGEVELIFDGKLITIHGMKRNAYVQIESPGDLDQALQNFGIETGLDFPGADLLYSDSYAGLMTDVVSGAYLGSGWVNGVECHHLTFRTPQVDWQIWIQTGDTPLPMQYIITTKWVTAAPQYVARLSNWNTSPKIAAERFEFTPGKGAKKLDRLPVGPNGELSVEGL